MQKQLISILIVLSLVSILPTIHFAQNSVSPSDEKTKLEKQELKKFFDEFVKSYEYHRDLNKIPTDFFAPNFKNTFAKNEKWISGDVYNQLSEDERFENNKSIVNLLYLSTIVLSHKFENIDNIEDSKDVRKVLSPITIKTIEDSKWFRFFLEEEGEFQRPRNKDEWQDLINDTKKVLEILPQELNDSSKEKANYKKNFDEWQEFNDFSSYICKEESCFGLPEKSEIYNLNFFFIDIKIAKMDEEFKIINFSLAIIFN